MQNSGIEVEVPSSFLFPPFNEKKVFNINPGQALEDILSQEPFYFDMLHLLKQDVIEAPWHNPGVSVPVIIQLFKELQPQLTAEYQGRKVNIQHKKRMIHSLSLFIVSLFWINETFVKTLNISDMELERLQIKPINCEERLSSIMHKPSQYHAFIQLQQLFNELEKLFYKSQVMKNSRHAKKDYSIE